VSNRHDSGRCYADAGRGYARIIAKSGKPTGILMEIDVLDYVIGKI